MAWEPSRRHIKELMKKAKVYHIAVCAKGLRHSFGISCTIGGVPTRVIQDLMRQSDVKITEIYTKFVGKEKR